MFKSPELFSKTTGKQREKTIKKSSPALINCSSNYTEYVKEQSLHSMALSLEERFTLRKLEIICSFAETTRKMFPYGGK